MRRAEPVIFGRLRHLDQAARTVRHDHAPWPIATRRAFRDRPRMTAAIFLGVAVAVVLALTINLLAGLF
jgi:hypothetical protein